MRYNNTVNRFIQKNRRSKIYSLPVIVILLILVVFLARATWKAYNESVETKKQVALMQAEFDEVYSRTNSLSQGLASLKTQEGIEKEIRKKFSVAKEGEQVVVVIEDNATPTTSDIQEKKGFFGRLIDGIKNILN